MKIKSECRVLLLNVPLRNFHQGSQLVLCRAVVEYLSSRLRVVPVRRIIPDVVHVQYSKHPWRPHATYLLPTSSPMLFPCITLSLMFSNEVHTLGDDICHPTPSPCVTMSHQAKWKKVKSTWFTTWLQVNMKCCVEPAIFENQTKLADFTQFSGCGHIEIRSS